MRRVWRQNKPPPGNKVTSLRSLHSVNGSESWTLLTHDLRELEAFHMSCQRGIHWYDFTRNSKVTATTNLPSIQNIISRRRDLLFGHVVRLDDLTPAHRELKLAIATLSGAHPYPNWRRGPGRPRNPWIQQIGHGTPFSI